MPAWWWIAVLGAGALVCGAITGWPLMQHVACVLIGLDLLALLVVRAAMRGLGISVAADRLQATAGDPIEETYTLVKRSRWPAFVVEVDDGEGVTTLSLGGWDTRTVRHAWVPECRGRYQVGGARVLVRDPFGLIRHHALTADTVEVAVLPRPVPVPNAIVAAGTAAASQHRWRPMDVDASLGDLRPYVEGDSPSRIHWRTSARRGVLMVTDPEARRPSALWLLVDLAGDPGGAERAAGIAAYLANRLCGAGQEMGAIICGTETVRVPVRPGKEQAARIAGALAVTETAPEPQVERLLRAVRVDRPGAIVLVADARQCGMYGARLRALCPVVHTIPAAAGGEGI